MSGSFFNHIATVADGVVVSSLYMVGYSSVANSTVSKFNTDGLLKWSKALKNGILGMSMYGDSLFASRMKSDTGDILISKINMEGDLVNDIDVSSTCSGMVKIHNGCIYDICNENGMGSISCIDMTGEPIWRSYVGGFYGGMEFSDFTIANDGFIYAVGVKTAEYGDRPLIGKWDLYGREIWVQLLKDVEGGFNCINVDSNGFLYAAGYDSLVTKWNTDGELVWKHSAIKGHTMRSITVDSDGYVYVAGRKNANSYLFKWNKDGKLVWEKMLENGLRFYNLITQIVSNGKDIFTIGLQVGKNNNTRGVLCKWDSDGCLKWDEQLT